MFLADTAADIGEFLVEQCRKGNLRIRTFGTVQFLYANIWGEAKPNKSEPASDPKPCEPFTGQGFRLGGVAYNGEVCGCEIHLSSDQLLLFLLDNGIIVNPVKHVTSALERRLRDTMRMIECDVQDRASTLSLRLRFDYDFQTYLANPKGFEDFVKDEVLLALGLDPVALPNAKKLITIEQVKAGSIEIGLCIMIGIVHLAVLVGCFASCCFTQYRQRQRSRFRCRIPADDAGTGADRLPAPEVVPEPVNLDHAANGTAGSIHSSDAPWLSQPDPSQSVSSLPARRVQLLDGAHREVQEVRFLNNSDGSFGAILRTTASQDNRCFMLRSLFQISGFEHKEAAGFKVGDQVLSPKGNILSVAFAKTHPRELRNLVLLRTAQAEITVTDDHRVVSFCPNGREGVVAAKDLRVGDLVRCGKHWVRLTVCRSFEQVVAVVEIRFDPDDPVETRELPSWSIWTKGAERHWALGWGSQGPTFFDATNQDGSRRGCAERRSRSM